MRTPSWLPLVVVLASVGAACSGGDDESSAESAASTTAAATTAVATTEPPTTPAPTTAAPTTAPATTAPPTTAPATTAPATTAPADPQAALAATALITLDDFAGGWTETAPDDDDDDEASQIIAACADVDVVLVSDELLGTTEAKAAFSTEDETFEVDHSVGFAADEATAVAAMAAIADPDVPGCYGEAVRTFFEEAQASTDPADTLPPGIEIGEVTTELGDLGGFALQADEGTWFHVQYPLTLADQTFEQHADFVFLRNGAALTQVLLTGFGATFPAEDIQGIVELADAKLATIA